MTDFFRQIPKAPGHYCRKDSNKIYITQIVPTRNKLYEVYKARCSALNKPAFPVGKFSNYFNGNKFSLFKREKDQCNTCWGYDEGNVEKHVFDAHQKKKNEGLALKQNDKDSADKTKVVLTTDTEALLLGPVNSVNVMYLRSKLNLHNFTFYNLKSRDVMNYLWSEINGEVDSNNFTSCFIYIDYLNSIREFSCVTSRVFSNYRGILLSGESSGGCSSIILKSRSRSVLTSG